jgi:hypothetical protein
VPWTEVFSTRSAVERADDEASCVTVTTGAEAPPETLVVLCLGGDEVCTALGDGRSLAAAIGRRTSRVPEVEVRHGPSGPLTDLLRTPGDWEPLLTGAHVVVRSISPDVEARHELPDGSGSGPLGDLVRPRLTDLVRRVKAAGPTFVAVNGATCDPDDDVHSYHDAGCTVALAVHRLDLELIHLSIAEGISVLDADRLQSQLGLDLGIEQALRYRQPLLDLLLDELALILDEYGWFDDRPILRQEGQRAKGEVA